MSSNLVIKDLYNLPVIRLEDVVFSWRQIWVKSIVGRSWHTPSLKTNFADAVSKVSDWVAYEYSAYYVVTSQSLGIEEKQNTKGAEIEKGVGRKKMWHSACGSCTN